MLRGNAGTEMFRQMRDLAGHLARVVGRLTGAVVTLDDSTRRGRSRVGPRAMCCGLRRSEVVRLRLEDVRVTKRRAFVAECKGERQRVIPVSGRFFAELVLMAISVMPLSAPRSWRPLPHRDSQAELIRWVKSTSLIRPGR